jgi:hypothetical protein
MQEICRSNFSIQWTIAERIRYIRSMPCCTPDRRGPTGIVYSRPSQSGRNPDHRRWAPAIPEPLPRIRCEVSHTALTGADDEGAIQDIITKFGRFAPELRDGGHQIIPIATGVILRFAYELFSRVSRHD